MLPNVRPKYDKSQSLDALLLSIHKLLMELPAIAPQHPLHASRTLSKQGIDVPYVRPLPTEETNWKVSFEKPSEIMLAGSWITKTAVKAKDSAPFTADLAIEMPSASAPLSFPCPPLMRFRRLYSRRKTTSTAESSKNALTT